MSHRQHSCTWAVAWCCEIPVIPVVRCTLLKNVTTVLCSHWRDTSLKPCIVQSHRQGLELVRALAAHCPSVAEAAAQRASHPTLIYL